MEKAKNQDGKEEVNKSRKSFFFSWITDQSNHFLKRHPKNVISIGKGHAAYKLDIQNQIYLLIPSSSISILPSLCCQIPATQCAHTLLPLKHNDSSKMPIPDFQCWKWHVTSQAMPCIIYYLPKTCRKPLAALHFHNIQDMKTLNFSKAGSSRCRQPDPGKMVLPCQAISHPRSYSIKWIYTCSRLIAELTSNNVRIRHSSAKFKTPWALNLSVYSDLLV